MTNTIPVKGSDGNTYNPPYFTPGTNGSPSADIITAYAFGLIVPVSATIARPANATAYAAGNSVNATSPANLSFANAARFNGGSGYIPEAKLMTDQAANTASFRLHLYNAAPTAIADQAAMTVLYANDGSYQGYIDFLSLATENTGTGVAAFSINFSPKISFVCGASSTTLYGQLEALTAFTPTSGQNFYVELKCDQN
jgi:hypothetical protein